MEKYSFVKVEKDGSFGFFLVNKEKSYAVIEKNLQLFQDLTGKKVCPRTLLQKSKPLKDCYASLITSLNNKIKEKEILNLQAAESYLCKISNREDIHEIVKDKLYYKIATTGAGEELKNTNNTPLISFRERALDGETLSENTSGVRISLSEMIPGLHKAYRV
ncbi:hypothetical protein [Candidatus Rhabdochlamydia sp. T3358]|uniref:hypothetical protein n=1 Tax=Candidatus Rhabdochlamydia sp. T3358 TaxID=2099795 RepID=UPI0010B84973|nr:hypothetical protein [Candidatus Rhabdochlamydia sp. T3358]VHO00798.1 hypothetical protein RHT_00181 [Candidatus Rhabdochlamydia sp. T3358]